MLNMFWFTWKKIMNVFAILGKSKERQRTREVVHIFNPWKYLPSFVGWQTLLYWYTKCSSLQVSGLGSALETRVEIIT